MLVITDPSNNEIETINGLDYVISSGVTGFDVTEENGVFEISIQEISVSDGSKTDYWTFELYFINLDSDQNANAGKTFDSEIILRENEMTLSENILLKEGGTEYIESKETPDFGIIAETNEGMLAIDDEYGTSYYFRGAVDDNWVYFAGYYWRIIRIDGEGNVKLIYSGTTAPTSETSVTMTGTGTQIGTRSF